MINLENKISENVFFLKFHFEITYGIYKIQNLDKT